MNLGKNFLMVRSANILFLHLDLFSDEMNSVSETAEKIRNIYYQKQLANEITVKVNKIISFLSLSINIHLNLGLNFLINTSQVFSLLEMLPHELLSNKTFKQVENAQIHLAPQFYSNLNQSQKILLRVNLFRFF